MLHFGGAGDSVSTAHRSLQDALLPWGLCPSSGCWNSCFSSPFLRGLGTPARAGQSSGRGLGTPARAGQLPQAHAY